MNAPVSLTPLEQALARSPLFAELGEATWRECAQLLQPLELAAHQPVFLQGAPGDRFYLVQQGRLKVVTANEEGEEVVLSLLGAGDCFGEIALLDGGPRSASVICNSRCQLAFLERELFFRTVARLPDGAERLFRALCERIRLLTERVEQISTRDFPQRLARTLLSLSQAHGVSYGGRHYLTMRISQGELASMARASREAVNKLLRQWQKSGWIDVVDGKIQILDADALLAH